MSGGEHKQIYADELVSQLYGEFQHRAEPQFAWKSLVSSFMAIPGLRGLWPMSSIAYTGTDRVRDVSGQGNHLTEAFTPQYGYDAANSLIPVSGFNGTNEYLRRADGGAGNWADILGTETYILPSQRGLTLGGWYKFDRLATTEYLIAKLVSPAQFSYRILKYNTNLPSFAISTTGVALTTTVTSTIAINTSRWFFVIGRFLPGSSVDIFVSNAADNKLTLTQQATKDAAIFSSTAPFTIAAQGTPTLYFGGCTSIQFLAASALSDALIKQLYEQSRALFNRV